MEDYRIQHNNVFYFQVLETLSFKYFVCCKAEMK
jgi:hypothetical protein